MPSEVSQRGGQRQRNRGPAPAASPAGKEYSHEYEQFSRFRRRRGEGEDTEAADPTAFTAPQMFAVGQTVDLINGSLTKGPLDWSSSWPQYQ